MKELTAWLNGERGRTTALASACSVTHSAICQWKRVPGEQVLMVEKVTGIPRQRLRPDLYGELEAAE